MLQDGQSGLSNDESGGIEPTTALFLLVYDELRRLATQHFRSQPAEHTLQPTALVHEVYERLRGSEDLTLNGRSHLLALANKMMRQILINHANRKTAKKRSGSQHREPMDDATATSQPLDDDISALREVLPGFAAQHPRPARVVVLRHFAGLTVKETAQELGVSVSTVEGDWRFARAFLSTALSSGE